MHDEGHVGHPDLEAIRNWLATRLAECVGVAADEIEAGEPFTSYGLSSQDLVMLSADLENWLGRPLSPTLGWEYPTLEALARHLAEECEAEQLPGQQ